MLVTTFNIADLPPLFAKKFPVDRRLERIANEVAPSDVVFFQEVFTHRRELKRLLRARGFKHFKASGSRLFGWLVWPSGLLVASKQPFEEYHARRFTVSNGLFGAGNDKLAPKGWQVVAIDGIWFVHTHMDAGDGTEDQAARAGQLAELESGYLTLVPEGAPAVWLGDFNLEDSRTDARPRAYHDTQQRRMLQERHNLELVVWFGTDGVLLNPFADFTKARGRVDLDNKLSDHPALEVDVVTDRCADDHR